MVFKQVYKHSKWLFLLMIVFIIGQLLVGYKHGMVVTPFYNYGMYSEVFKVNNSYEVWEVKCDGKQLRGQDFSPQEWDRILLPVQYYAAINSSNKFYKAEVKRLFQKVHIEADENKFLQACNYPQFEAWYKTYLGNIIHQPIITLDVSKRTFEYRFNQLTATNAAVPLAGLCR